VPVQDVEDNARPDALFSPLRQGEGHPGSKPGAVAPLILPRGPSGLRPPVRGALLLPTGRRSVAPGHAPSTAFRGPPPPHAFGYGGGVSDVTLPDPWSREAALNLMEDDALGGPARSRTAEGCRSAARRSRVLDRAGPPSRLRIREVKAGRVQEHGGTVPPDA